MSWPLSGVRIHMRGGVYRQCRSVVFTHRWRSFSRVLSRAPRGSRRSRVGGGGVRR